MLEQGASLQNTSEIILRRYFQHHKLCEQSTIMLIMKAQMQLEK